MGDTVVVDISKGWEFRAVGGEGEPVDIAGINPWKVEWEPVPVGSAVVADPSYPGQQHTLSVYRLSGVEPAVFFAAGEFSNGVWGFYEPTQEMRTFLLSRVK